MDLMADPSMTELAHCPWCGTQFTPRTSGGKAQRFCSPLCRRHMERALRAWAQDQLAKGQVTMADLQHATRAFA